MLVIKWEKKKWLAVENIIGDTYIGKRYFFFNLNDFAIIGLDETSNLKAATETPMMNMLMIVTTIQIDENIMLVAENNDDDCKDDD